MAESKKPTSRSSSSGTKKSSGSRSTSGGSTKSTSRSTSATRTRSTSKSTSTGEKVVKKAKAMANDAQSMASNAADSAMTAASGAASAAMEGGEMMVEQIETTGTNLVEKIKEIIQEGNARHVRIRNEDGDTIMEMPLTAGVAVGSGVAVAMLAAIGGLASVLSSKVNIDVRKPRQRTSTGGSGTSRTSRS